MLDLRSPFILLILGTLAIGACAPEDDETPLPDADAFRALTSAQGDHFEIVTWPREETGPAMRSSGHLIVRLQGGPASTGPGNEPGPDDVAGTCGVTFVSPDLAVTAGHCLPGLSELDVVEVRTPRVLPTFVPNPTISGVFPNYTHTDAPGHDFDRYHCQVRARCYSGLPNINCTITAGDVSGPFSLDAVDIGILECDALDGARHDYVRIAETVAEGDRLAMPWFHELYEEPTTEPSATNFDNFYVKKTSFANNYHYLGAGVRHQMLPLMSTDYYGDRWRVVDPPPDVVLPAGVVVPTNLRGCHGTSGSGVMSTENGYPELVGPVATGHGSIGGPTNATNYDLLCHVAGADDDDDATIRAMHPDVTRYFVDAYLPPSCANPESFPNRLMYWLSCDILTLEDLDYVRWDLRPPFCPWCSVAMRMDSSSREAMMFSAAEPTSLGLRPNVLGQTYRASVRVWTNDFPTTVQLRMGDTTIATHTLEEGEVEYNGNAASAVLAASFVADAATDGPLTVAVTGQSAAQDISVSQVLLVPDGQTGAFETMHRRVGYGVHDVASQTPEAVPMSFAGSPTGGYAAVLDKGQRMVATGLALTASSRWHVDLSGDPANLRCGLLLPDGSEIETDCATDDGGVVLDGTGQPAPVALYVEHGGTGHVSLYDLVVTEVSSCQPAHPTCETGVALAPTCDDCVDQICNVDPYCCATYWDSICVGEVLSVCDQAYCPASQGSCAHSICATGPKLSASCDAPPISPSCTAAICNVDPYCCGTYWDSICVGEVDSVCGLGCG